MKCQILFSEKNKKNISKCRLLKILPRVLSVKCQSQQQQMMFQNIFILFPLKNNKKYLKMSAMD